MVAGIPPIRAKKARYFEDPRLAERILPTPKHSEEAIIPKPDDWSALAPVVSVSDRGGCQPRMRWRRPTSTARMAMRKAIRPTPACVVNPASNGTDIAPEPIKPAINELDPDMDQRDDAIRVRALSRNARNIARQVSLDPGDGMEL